MIFFPAIDLKDGQCVRLFKGDMAQATVYTDDPAAQARVFANSGCPWVHVVDLNGAVSGRPINAEAVKHILAVEGLQVQLGGGIRTLETIAFWLRAGVARVVLGTAAVKDPDLVRQACTAYPGRIAVGIDARAGMVAVEGWVEETTIAVADLARLFTDVGVAAFIHTDIDRDGAMEGPNVAASINLARTVPVPVILSGGVSSTGDLERVRDQGRGVLAGVISGRAIYDGRVDPAAAVRLLAA